MLPHYTVAYINPDHLSREIVKFTIECSEAQCWSFETTQAFLDTLEAGDFDSVLVAGVPDNELLNFEAALHESGHYLPIINVTNHRNMQALIDSLRHGRSIWGAPPADR